MRVITIFISFLASVIGAVCGIGGSVIFQETLGGAT
jgi:hypothetical protein